LLGKNEILNGDGDYENTFMGNQEDLIKILVELKPLAVIKG